MNPCDERQDRVDERRFVRLEQSSRPHALAANEKTTHLALRVPPDRGSGVEFWAEVLDVSEQKGYAEHGRRQNLQEQFQLQSPQNPDGL